MTRRTALLTTLSATAACFSRLSPAAEPGARLRHSVCRAPFARIPLDEFCEACKGMGIESIELLEPPDYPAAFSIRPSHQYWYALWEAAQGHAV